MYDGTLGTKGPWEALVTFQQMIILADKQGIVDKTPEAIARTTTIPLKIIQKGIKALEAPDPDSRTPDEEGRRIVRLSDDRDWGWRIVNHGHYRKMRSADERREYMRQYMKDRRAQVNSPVSELAAVNPEQPIAVSSMQEAVGNKQEALKTPPLCEESFLEQLLARVPEPAAWRAEIGAMLAQMPGHYHATPEQIETAARDMLGNGKLKDPNMRQFRRYVEGAKPAAPQNGKPVVSGKAGWLVKKEQDDRDEYLNRDPAVQERVSHARDADPAWWERMTAEAKAADRWATVYAYDQLEASNART